MNSAAYIRGVLIWHYWIDWQTARQASQKGGFVKKANWRASMDSVKLWTYVSTKFQLATHGVSELGTYNLPT